MKKNNFLLLLFSAIFSTSAYAQVSEIVQGAGKTVITQGATSSVTAAVERAAVQAATNQAATRAITQQTIQAVTRGAVIPTTTRAAAATHFVPVRAATPYVSPSQQAFRNIANTVHTGLSDAVDAQTLFATMQKSTAHGQLAQKLAITMMPVAQFQVESPVDMKIFQRFYYKWKKNETRQYMETAYQTYVETLQTVQTFAQRINSFIQAQAQNSTLVPLGKDTPDSLLAQLSQIRKMLKETSQSMKIADPAILRSNQYLQNAQFYLDTLASGKTNTILQTSELSFMDADKVWGFYLQEDMWADYAPQAKRVSFWENSHTTGLHNVEVKRLPVPSQLRIAVIDEDEAMRQAIARISSDPQAAKWKVETFETPEQFLAKPDYMFYDVVIGDFVFGIHEKYSIIPQTLQKANFSGLVLSCSNANPAAWTASGASEIDERPTWFQFAQGSREIGIDGNLELFGGSRGFDGEMKELVKFKRISGSFPPEATIVARDTDVSPEDLINKIKAAYWVKGGGDGYVTNSGYTMLSSSDYEYE